jgi:hypothetical protein
MSNFNQYSINSNNNILIQDNPENFNDNNFSQNQMQISGEQQFMYQSNEGNINEGENGTNNFNNTNNTKEVNDNININIKPKMKFTSKLYDKICSYINELKEIDNVVPFCEERNRRELLLDRGLLLCLKINEYMDDCCINIDSILNFNKTGNIEFDIKLLDENYWMNQKVDKYARTEQRKRIPQEKWFMLKDVSFTPNLMKCFALNRGKFIDTYNWLNSLENK